MKKVLKDFNVISALKLRGVGVITGQQDIGVSYPQYHCTYLIPLHSTNLAMSFIILSDHSLTIVI
jgi:hypothetical protein